eukprot:scaffold248986_cov30-Tisochrysis_lutea.AAC.5
MPKCKLVVRISSDLRRRLASRWAKESDSSATASHPSCTASHAASASCLAGASRSACARTSVPSASTGATISVTSWSSMRSGARPSERQGNRTTTSPTSPRITRTGSAIAASAAGRSAIRVSRTSPRHTLNWSERASMPETKVPRTRVRSVASTS